MTTTSAQCLAGFAALGGLLLLGNGTEPAIMAPPSPYNVSSGLSVFEDMLHSHSALQSDFDLGRLRGTLAHDALGAIGGLMQARTGQPLCFSRLPPSPPGHNAGLSTAIATSVDLRIGRCQLPPADAPPPGLCLRALLGTNNTFELEDGNSVRPYDPEKLNVCKVDLSAVALKSALDNATLQFAVDPDRYIVRADDDLPADC